MIAENCLLTPARTLKRSRGLYHAHFTDFVRKIILIAVNTLESYELRSSERDWQEAQAHVGGGLQVGGRMPLSDRGTDSQIRS